MNSDQEYDSENIFAKILRGDMDACKVCEDEHSLVIMDAFPQASGHALVIPKAPGRNILDLEPAAAGHAIQMAQRVAQAMNTAFKPDGIVVQQFNEPAAGQTVFHFHIHVVPRYEGVSLRPHGGDMADRDELEKQAERLRAALDPS
jgi:histidine triad (HIT) family protein